MQQHYDQLNGVNNEVLLNIEESSRLVNEASNILANNDFKLVYCKKDPG